ncbi:Acyltransferase-domain-containing protein [Pyrenophora teres f. maculata]|nr:Acyltransferase-domain-containing protein [Pyrenophora teres f. maculata]
MPPATKKPVVVKPVAAKTGANKPPAANQSATKSPVPAAVQRKKKVDLGAGLRVTKDTKDNVDAHPAGPPRFGELTQAERAFTLASTFLSGVLAQVHVFASQFLGAPLKLIDPQFYDAYMAYTKECFAILITCLTQWWAPTVVRVSGDSSMVGQLIKRKDGSLQCNFSDRMVLMANHQLYTDWLYLWWIAYTNNMHGFIYIILKESLKNIPIIGWGAQFYNFIFLSRKWEEDQRTFKKHLSKLNKKGDPMWLIIFPEGTNLSPTTRERSKQWADKNGLQDMKHQLLPRSTGLRFCLNELKETTDWLYDCTIAYEGIPPGQFGQDIFTLRSSFFEGRPPKSVNMHWRRFRISDIPCENTHAFEVWLRNRWREKDYMLEYFSRHTRFPAEDFWKNHLDMDTKSESSRGGPNGSRTIRTVARPAVQIETEVKSGNWNEFVKIFAPITSVMMALTVAYGASPEDLPIPGGKEFFEQHLKTLLGQGSGGGELKGLPSPDQLEKMIEGAAKMGAAQAAGGQNQVPESQRLTQENLAKLVKETAISSGAVMPNGMRRASTALPPPPLTQTMQTPTTTAAARKPQSARNMPTMKSSPSPGTKKAPAARTPPPKPKSPPTNGPMKEVTTASGVTIKVPAPQVQAAAKTNGVLTMANGVKIKIDSKDVEEKKGKGGGMVMTAGGVPIRVTKSGGLEVGKAAVKSAGVSAGAVKKTADASKKKGSGPRKL